jgi:hypothetical protein
MSAPTPLGLLQSHVRALEAAVAGSAVAHEKFEWRLVDAAWTGSGARTPLPAMVHAETGFLFSIEYQEPWQDEFGAGGPAEFRYFRAPGVPGSGEMLEARAWNEVLFDFRLWLRLIAKEIGRHDGSDASRRRSGDRFMELWPLLHPDIRSIARSSFDTGQYSEAVIAALKLADPPAELSRLLAAALQVREGDATLEMNEATAIHFLFLASLIRRKLGDRSAASPTERAAPNHNG